MVMAAQKLHYYFQSHKIKIPTSFPLREMFENREASGRIGKWATQIAEHTIDFVSRSAIITGLGRLYRRLDSSYTFA